MSFCPTKDIHSVYLDNEMPEIYKGEYESHIQNCAKCKTELERLRAIRSVFQADSNSICLDAQFMEDSFSRLQTKLSYSKNVGKTERPKGGNWLYAVSGIAAAAVFALIVPINYGKNAQQNVNANMNANVLSSSVASTPLSTNSTTVTIPTNVAAMLPRNTAINVNSANNVAFNSGKNALNSSRIHGRALSTNSEGNIQSAIAQNVKSVDFLRPNFRDELISIRITVPGMGESPVVTEITLPREVVSGRF